MLLGSMSGGVSLASVGSVARGGVLVLAVLSTGLISGFFYAYACSVTLGLALLPDELYVEAVQAINATVRNGVFAFSFFGAVLFLLVALAVHLPRWRSRRFLLLTVTALFYVGGGFMVTFLVNVPMIEELARVGEAGPAALARVRAEGRGAVELLERCAHGFLVAGVPGPYRRLPLAAGLRAEGRAWVYVRRRVRIGARFDVPREVCA